MEGKGWIFGYRVISLKLLTSFVVKMSLFFSFPNSIHKSVAFDVLAPVMRANNQRGDLNRR